MRKQAVASKALESILMRIIYPSPDENSRMMDLRLLNEFAIGIENACVELNILKNKDRARALGADDIAPVLIDVIKNVVKSLNDEGRQKLLDQAVQFQQNEGEILPLYDQLESQEQLNIGSIMGLIIPASEELKREEQHEASEFAVDKILWSEALIKNYIQELQENKAALQLINGRDKNEYARLELDKAMDIIEGAGSSSDKLEKLNAFLAVHPAAENTFSIEMLNMELEKFLSKVTPGRISELRILYNNDFLNTRIAELKDKFKGKIDDSVIESAVKDEFFKTVIFQNMLHTSQAINFPISSDREKEKYAAFATLIYGVEVCLTPTENDFDRKIYGLIDSAAHKATENEGHVLPESEVSSEKTIVDALQVALTEYKSRTTYRKINPMQFFAPPVSKLYLDLNAIISNSHFSDSAKCESAYDAFKTSKIPDKLLSEILEKQGLIDKKGQPTAALAKFAPQQSTRNFTMSDED